MIIPIRKLLAYTRFAHARVNMSFPPEHYEPIYDRGAGIYRFR